MKISIVSPVYQAQNIIDELVIRIIGSVREITDDYEIILVDDGSSDSSWNKIEKMNSENEIAPSSSFTESGAVC